MVDLIWRDTEEPVPDPSGKEETPQPPQAAIDIAIEQARFSPCRSKRGAVVFTNEVRALLRIGGRGHNRKPEGFDCDGSEACKSTCGAEAVHAEQKALLNAGTSAHGADLLHVKVVDGALVPSGGPSCVQCSKLALSAGIAGVWLFHEHGWARYSAENFHRLSIAAVPAVPASRQSTKTLKAQVDSFRKWVSGGGNASASTPKTQGEWFFTEQPSKHDCYATEFRLGARWPGVAEHYLGVVYHRADAQFIVDTANNVSASLSQTERKDDLTRSAGPATEPASVATRPPAGKG